MVEIRERVGMINDDAAWIQLLKGLTVATREGRLEWQEKSSKTARNFVDAVGSQISLSKPKVYSTTRSLAIYEISSVDAFGTDPYQLDVWEHKLTKLVPLGSLRSSIDTDSAERLMLNRRLADLYKAVAEAAESSEDIVNRLLGDL
jgi:hypothetical protein